MIRIYSKAYMNDLFSFAVALVLATLAIVQPLTAQKLKPEEIVAKHLESIGSNEARTAVRSQITVGDAVVKFISRKNGIIEGRIVMASSGEKNFVGLNLNALDYPGERFSFDGTKAKVANTVNGQKSVLASFVSSNDLILRESLLGGVLSSSWALSNLSVRKAKLSPSGMRTVDGRDYYVLNYSPKGGGDIDISLYFDKETFRHTRTEYTRTASAAIGRTIDESARQSETRLKVIEDFSDFKVFSGLTLPQSYKLLYTTIGQNGTTEVEWAYRLNEFAFNQTMDEKAFDAEAK
jgi:hypothetical protein